MDREKLRPYPLRDAAGSGADRGPDPGDVLRRHRAHDGRATAPGGGGVLWRSHRPAHQYDQRDLCIIDILNQGCTKGHALRRWADHHGIAPEEVMAIGDNYNDLEMLEFAGLPVIMGNASDDLKTRGWTVTSSNLESGVAVAVERIIQAGIAPPIEVK